MDFIEGLPNSNGYSIIMVGQIDSLNSKYAHFIPITHPYNVVKTTKIFIANIFKLHGMPSSIVSDRDPTFTSNFWKELFKLQGTEFKLSSSYRPQTDGQTELVNKCMEQYLKCYAGDRPKEWVKWYSPPKLLPYTSGTSSVQEVDDELRTRDHVLSILKCNLQIA